MSAKVLRLGKAKQKTWERVSHNLVLHRPSGTYYARKFRAGKGEFFKTTGEKRKGRAQTLADQMIGEWIGGKRLSTRRYRIDELCKLLFADLQEEARERNDDGSLKRRQRTQDRDYEMYREADPEQEIESGTIVKLFGETWADEVDEIFWQDWVRGPGRKLGRSLGDIAKCLSKVLTFAFERKIINRKARIKDPDPERTEKPTYRVEDIQLFWDHSDLELQDLIVIAAECGPRPHESCGIRWEWVTISRKRVTVAFPGSFTKTRKGRAIKLSPRAALVIRRRHRARGASPFVFPAPKDPFKPMSDVMRSRLWRRMLVRAGVKTEAKFHWLRHTWFTQALLHARKPLAGVAAYGGNSPKVAFGYMAKDAEATADIVGAVDLDLDGEE